MEHLSDKLPAVHPVRQSIFYDLIQVFFSYFYYFYPDIEFFINKLCGPNYLNYNWYRIRAYLFRKIYIHDYNRYYRKDFWRLEKESIQTYILGFRLIVFILKREINSYLCFYHDPCRRTDVNRYHAHQYRECRKTEGQTRFAGKHPPDGRQRDRHGHLEEHHAKDGSRPIIDEEAQQGRGEQQHEHARRDPAQAIGDEAAEDVARTSRNRQPPEDRRVASWIARTP